MNFIRSVLLCVESISYLSQLHPLFASLCHFLPMLLCLSNFHPVPGNPTVKKKGFVKFAKHFLLEILLIGIESNHKYLLKPNKARHNTDLFHTWILTTDTKYKTVDIINYIGIIIKTMYCNSKPSQK